MGWHFNGKSWDDPPDFFPASRFRKQFYRPDIVQLVLRVKDKAIAVDTANNLAGQRVQDSGGGTATEPGGGLGIRGILPGVVEFAEDALEIETDKPDIQLHSPALALGPRHHPRRGADGRRPGDPRSVVAVDARTTPRCCRSAFRRAIPR